MEDGGAVIGKLAYFHQGCVGQLFQNSGQISSETSVGGVAHHVDGFAVYFFFEGKSCRTSGPDVYFRNNRLEGSLQPQGIVGEMLCVGLVYACVLRTDWSMHAF